MLKKGCIVQLIALTFLISGTVYALPQDPSVSHGEAKFDQVDAQTLNITASNKSIINYSSFNIGRAETVNFHLPSVSAFSLNRVLGNSVSRIRGTLTANGNLILVNPKGIFFGSSANVNVGGLIASTQQPAKVGAGLPTYSAKFPRAAHGVGIKASYHLRSESHVHAAQSCTGNGKDHFSELKTS